MHHAQCYVRAADGSAAAPVHLVIGHAGATTSPNLLPEQPSFWHRVDLVHGFLRIEANATVMTCEVSRGLREGFARASIHASWDAWPAFTVQSCDKVLMFWTRLHASTALIIIAGHCLLSKLCSAFHQHPQRLILQDQNLKFWLACCFCNLNTRSSTPCLADVVLASLAKTLSLAFLPGTLDHSVAKI